MKKLLLSFLVVCAGMGACVANADAHGYYRGGYWHGGCWGCGAWVAPAVIGGVIGYELAKPPVYTVPPVVVPTPPVVYTQPPVVVQPNCSAWTEIRNPDGTVTTQRVCQ
jgi:hypothetical protein